jgi:hypothetical protein
MNQARNNDTTESALGKLDEVLYLLMGAADATARVAHIALNIGGTERNAGWQNQGWLRSVANQEPALAALVQNENPGEHTINILRLLRNSIHGEGLQGISLLHDRERYRETLLTLSQDDEPALLSAMDALGGREQWGVRPIVPGRIHIEPDAFVDKLFEAVTELLNQVMTHTPVERLSDVRLTPADCSPPADQPNNINMFSENSRHSIRWQLGF